MTREPLHTWAGLPVFGCSVCSFTAVNRPEDVVAHERREHGIGVETDLDAAEIEAAPTAPAPDDVTQKRSKKSRSVPVTTTSAADAPQESAHDLV